MGRNIVYNNLPMSSYSTDITTLSTANILFIYSISLQGRYMRTLTTGGMQDSFPLSFSLWSTVNTVFVLFLYIPRMACLTRYVSPTQIRRHPLSTRIWGGMASLALLSYLAQILTFYIWWCSLNANDTALWSPEEDVVAYTLYDSLLILAPACTYTTFVLPSYPKHSIPGAPSNLQQRRDSKIYPGR